jgi:glutathione S-transferase
MRPLFRCNMGLDAGRLGRARTRLDRHWHFASLESEIGPSGVLVGSRFGVADLAAASVMTSIIGLPAFPHSLPEPGPNELVGFRQSGAHRPGFRWLLEIYAGHRGASREIAPRALRAARPLLAAGPG